MRRRKNVCIAVLLGCPMAAPAADRIVDSARREPGVFRTIQACATASQPADRCLVAGGRYRETVFARNQTRIEARPGQAAVIDGTDPLDGWTSLGNGAWRIAYSKPNSVPAIQIFIDGTPGVGARWPNGGTDPVRPNWSTMQSGTTATTIVDASLPPGNWRGATVHMFSGDDAYSHTSATVTASAPGQLIIAYPGGGHCPVFCATQGGLYYLYGTKLAANAAGEWYMQGGMLTLLLAPGANPNGGHVTAKARVLGIDLGNASGTTVSGMQLFAASIATGPKSHVDTITGITAHYLSELTQLATPKQGNPIAASVANSGILLRGTGHTLSNSTLDTSAGNGVTLLGPNMVISNNLFNSMGYLGSYVAPIQIVDGQGAQILHNTVENASGYGITGGLGPQSLAGAHIAYNNIHDALVERVDGGPIYFCCAGVNTDGLSIDHNWVHAFTAPIAPFLGDGILLDNGLGTGATVTQNFITKPDNGEGGIALNGENTGETGTNAVVRYNTVQGSILASIWYSSQINLTVLDNNIVDGTLRDYGGNSFASGSPARNGSAAAGATDLMPDPNAAGAGCNFAGCSSPPP